VSSAHGTAKGQPALCPWIPRARVLGAAGRNPRRRPVGANRDWSAERIGIDSSSGTRKIARSISCSSVSAARQGGLSRSSRSRRARVARRRSSNRFIKVRCRSSIARSAVRHRRRSVPGAAKASKEPAGSWSTVPRAHTGHPVPRGMAPRSRAHPFSLHERGDREPTSLPCYPSRVLCGWSCEAGVPVP
jgi:hypothetical protein